MNKILLPIAMLALIVAPAANAAQCRDSASGKFAKCGAPGAVPASQYVPKTKMAKTAHAKAAPMAAAAPAAKPGLMSMLKPKAKPTPAAKAARCKTAKGKFTKCGTPGAVPA